MVDMILRLLIVFILIFGMLIMSTVFLILMSKLIKKIKNKIELMIGD